MEEYICSNLSRLINACGLISDIVGVLLLWKFGLPESISRQGHQYLICEQTDETEIIKAKKYDKYAKAALLFIIIGFALQIISDFI
ncbi:MAG: hypothetical protein Q7I89_09260 [Syntrophales bacterium]|nr:hypothetical protein [Syntrophales bacterium]